jgi:amino acid transporter
VPESDKGKFSVLMALFLMATGNALITIGPRVYCAMAKNRSLPAAAARVHPKWHTPAIAIVAQAICAMLTTMTPAGLGNRAVRIRAPAPKAPHCVTVSHSSVPAAWLACVETLEARDLLRLVMMGSTIVGY